MRTLLITATLAMSLPSVAAATPRVGPSPDAELVRDVGLRFGPQAVARADALTGRLTTVRKIAVETTGTSPAERARGFLQRHGDLWQLATAPTATKRVIQHARGAVVHFPAQLDGVPVEGRSVAVSLDAQGRVTRVQADPTPASVIPLRSDVGAAAAIDTVRKTFVVSAVGGATKVVLATGPTPGRLAYRVPVAVLPMQGHFSVWVDAATGGIIRALPASADQTIRTLTRREVAR